ncbi:hypothetical protein ABZ512_07070 [Nocardiopsis dassonvillei]|uniref:hypothetical protein n=1 Tax=Nocardiopsis dassonvillei TaxID=2014 RepID=UPI003409902B
MLPAVCAAVVALYVLRFLVTESAARSGAHPRTLSDFREALEDARRAEIRENAISFGRAAVHEKTLVLDNMLATVNFRGHAGGGEASAGLADDAERRFAEYSDMVARLDGEVEEAVSRERDSSAAGPVTGYGPGAGSTGPGARGARLARTAHVVCMVALASLVIAVILAG